MRIYLFAICLFYNYIALSQESTFFINGTISSNFNNQSIMLFKFKGDSVNSVDTTIIKDGIFEFKGKEYLEEISLITIGNYPNKIISSDVVLENGVINVSIGIEKCRSTGTPLNNLFQAYRDTIEVMDAIVIAEYKKNIEGKEIPVVDTYQQLLKNRVAYRSNFKLQNINNIVGQTAFIREVGAEWDPLFLETYETLPNKVKYAPKVKWYASFLREEQNSTKILNNSFIDLTFQSLSGEEQKISDFTNKNKYLYIDFWASWCAPCIADIPELKKVYDKYKDYVDFISISIDTKKNSWVAACEKLNMLWPNLVDLSGGSELMKIYEFSAIPYGILINKEGSVIAEKLSSLSLKSELKNISF